MGRIIEPDKLQHELTRALHSLMKRTHETACVLLEDQATEKFIQFGRGPELILDLPVIGLSGNEEERAREAFLVHCSESSRILEAPDVDAESITRQFEVLQCPFGTSAESAAAAAIKVFNSTYQLKDVTYLLHEN